MVTSSRGRSLEAQRPASFADAAASPTFDGTSGAPRSPAREGDGAQEAGDELRPAARLYLAAVVLAGFVVSAALLVFARPEPPDRLALAIALLGAMVLAGLWPLPLARGTKLYLDSAVLIAVAILYEPGVGVMVVVTGAVLAHLLRRQPVPQMLFNGALVALLVAAASGLLEVTGRWAGDGDLHRLTPALLAMAVGVTVCLLNALVLAPMIAFHSGGSIPRLWVGLLLGPDGAEGLGHVVQVVVGVVVARLALDHSWMVAMLLLPAGGAYHVLAHHVRRRRLAEARLVHQAYHDPLTGLPNRALLCDRLDRVLTRETPGGRRSAILFVDLDRFKFVNDSLGHAAGDQLLVDLGQRLVTAVGPGATVARFGGDEFCVLLEGLADPREAECAAARAVAALDAPFLLDGHEVTVTASIGIASAGPGRMDSADLLRSADVALQEAKQRGKARWAVFDEGMGAAARERVALELDLRRAIERGELVLDYQPQVELATGRVVGVEALVRWRRPGSGLLGPDAFVPLAEDNGLILPIGRWVLEEACRQARFWQEHHREVLTVSVNLSAREFQRPDLVADVAAALRSAGLEPRRLKLEITESAVMGDTGGAAATLRRLKDLGVQIAIDDFGTGYSSLARLRRLPVDLLKIDKGFVAGLGADPADAAVVRTVVGLSAALGLGVVAEGVETRDQMAQLRECGCQLGQGFYFGRPMSAAALGGVLEGRGGVRDAPVPLTG